MATVPSSSFLSMLGRSLQSPPGGMSSTLAFSSGVRGLVMWSTSSMEPRRTIFWKWEIGLLL